jgi:hypothetical protein
LDELLEHELLKGRKMFELGIDAVGVVIVTAVTN